MYTYRRRIVDVQYGASNASRVSEGQNLLVCPQSGQDLLPVVPAPRLALLTAALLAFAGRVQEILGEVVPVARLRDGLGLGLDAAVGCLLVAAYFVLVVLVFGNVVVLIELFLCLDGLKRHVPVCIHALFPAQDLVCFAWTPASVAVRCDGTVVGRRQVLGLVGMSVGNTWRGRIVAARLPALGNATDTPEF